ncbi:branched-chain amino acid ABC transporter permease [Amycolatopsis suaedae]|uniref:Branched-chain amino acid ABC transporter permease n=2 Tax=Amycolatopsis suaedae TaxID=2510978 RepID=A0A4Q7IZV3_9PSEU|nr:branched-chain amino acid ABC transporter permease [Amycolatopsis suaedae]
MRVGSGFAVATFVLGLTFGAFTQSLGWGLLAPVVCSLVVFSGSAQFAMATALAGGGNLAVAVGAAALINARFLPMGVAVAGALRGGRIRRALEGQAVVDASWAAAHLGGGRYDREKLIGATLVQAPAWVLGTLAGVLAAPPPDVVTRFGLDLVFPGFFLVLLLGELRASRRAREVAALAAVLAGLLVLVVPVGIALIGSSVAALLALLPEREAA